jgi:hypothetical protein
VPQLADDVCENMGIDIGQLETGTRVVLLPLWIGGSGERRVEFQLVLELETKINRIAILAPGCRDCRWGSVKLDDMRVCGGHDSS